MTSTTPPSYWFVLGREPLLSTAELVAFFNLKKYDVFGPILKTAIGHGPIDSNVIMNRLGGTIKMGIALGNNFSEAGLIEALVAELNTVEGKIHFGISLYDDKKERGTWSKLSPGRNPAGAGEPIEKVARWGKEIKLRLKDHGRSVRHVYNREAVLSSVTVEKNGLTKRGREFLIMKDPSGTFSLAKTLAVQPFEALSARDFGRPGRDDASGMLPPKLAMMMLNVAQARLDDVILDPFCGSGTIVTEALLAGFNNIIGTDISEHAIEDSKKNVTWLLPGLPVDTREPRLFTADVFTLRQSIPNDSIAAIVTEPYLGKPLTGRETREMLLRQITELHTLYSRACQEFYTLLKPGGRAVVIIPRFLCGREWITLPSAELIKKSGLVISPLLPNNEFLLYARPGQHVGREIWRLVKP